MYLVYAPEEGERQQWWFDPKKVRAQEAEAIEKRTGWDWNEFGAHLLQGSVLARRALLWMFQRRVHHTLRFDDVDFAAGEVDLEFSKDELAQIRDGIIGQESIGKAERDLAVATFDQQIAEAKDAPGKAPASSSD